MHTTHKRICLVLLSVLITAALACVCAFIWTPQNTSYATDDVSSNLQETHSHEEMTALSVYPTDGELSTGAYYLTANIDGNITVSGDVTLCLNGHNVQGDGTDAVITVSEGAAFTLCDCQQQSGCITGGTGYDEGEVGGGVYVAANATFTMDGGTISGNSANVGGGVFVGDNATFSMRGGTISGNSAGVLGGGGVRFDGTFEVSGNPNITGNTDTDGNVNNVLILQPITVTGALTSGAQIGVYAEDCEIFATGYCNNNKDLDGNIIVPSSYFVSDRRGCMAVAGYGEVILVTGAVFVQVNGSQATYISINDAFAAVSQDVTTANSPAVIKLFDDVEAANTLTVASGSFITLDLNGHNLQGDGEHTVIAVNAGATFTLCDSKETGCITGGRSSCGGGVNVQGTFIMNGGNISDNTATNGGGVYVNLSSGSMLMTGGAISNNTATNGGGVYTDLDIPLPPPVILSKTSSKAANVLALSQDDWRFTFTMIGGEISGNSADTGGGVFVSESSTFSMDGGAISGNSADTGGGVEVYGTFEVSNNPNIMGNTNTDGDNDNVRIAQPITVTGALASGAQIGVYTTGEITSGYGDNNKDLDGNIIAPDNYFVADDDRYTLVLEDEEIKLVEMLASVTIGNDDPVEYFDILDAWDAANDATTSQDSPAVVKLLTNVTTEYNLPVANGSFITLDLNGYTLRYVGDLKFSVITVDGALTLQDSRPQAEHNYDVTDDGLWVFNDYGEHTLYGGVIIGGKLGGVRVSNGGSFTMNGGAISGNTADRDNYGGVSVGENAQFTMNDGAISGNTTNSAGGVYVRGGTFTMTGGEISNNTAVGTGGVAVLAYNSLDDIFYGSFTMSGGAISNNTSTHDAGGVTITSGCMFTMSGTAVISGNTGVYWGGVFMSGGTITMEGGEISGNTATHELGQGGGVYASGTFTMNGGKISGNQAANGGGVYFSGGTFTMEGGEISGNTAMNNGGGVFVRTGAFKVSGAVNITGNKATDGSDSNVYMLEDLHITVADALTDGAQIGVSNSGVVATGFKQDDKPSKYFIPDNPVYNCVYVNDASLGAVTIDEHDIISHEAKQPTCTENGYQAYEVCTHCDYAIDKVDLLALGHDYGEWTVVKQATQDEEGLEQRVCSRDSSHVETRPIAKLAATEQPPKQPPMQQPEQSSEPDWIWIVLLVVLALIILCEVLYLIYILKLKKIANYNKGEKKR